jgi:hypothetical protein
VVPIIFSIIVLTIKCNQKSLTIRCMPCMMKTSLPYAAPIIWGLKLTWKEWLFFGCNVKHFCPITIPSLSTNCNTKMDWFIIWRSNITEDIWTLRLNSFQCYCIFFYLAHCLVLQTEQENMKIGSLSVVMWGGDDEAPTQSGLRSSDWNKLFLLDPTEWYLPFSSLDEEQMQFQNVFCL